MHGKGILYSFSMHFKHPLHCTAVYMKFIIVKMSDQSCHETLSDEEAEELMNKYGYLFGNSNVVCLDYCKPPLLHAKFKRDGVEIPPGQKALCIGVIENDPSIDDDDLPTIAVYETPTKHVEVPVCVHIKEGEIKAL